MFFLAIKQAPSQDTVIKHHNENTRAIGNRVLPAPSVAVQGFPLRLLRLYRQRQLLASWCTRHPPLRFVGWLGNPERAPAKMRDRLPPLPAHSRAARHGTPPGQAESGRRVRPPLRLRSVAVDRRKGVRLFIRLRRRRPLLRLVEQATRAQARTVHAYPTPKRRPPTHLTRLAQPPRLSHKSPVGLVRGADRPKCW